LPEEELSKVDHSLPKEREGNKTEINGQGEHGRQSERESTKHLKLHIRISYFHDRITTLCTATTSHDEKEFVLGLLNHGSLMKRGEDLDSILRWTVETHGAVGIYCLVIYVDFCCI
jgi:hypothetical protein